VVVTARRLRGPSAAVLVLGAMLTPGLTGGVGRAQATRSVFDGVYSDAQATRGREAFVRACAYCHGTDLRGGDDPPGPALSGRIFMAKWRARTVAELFLTIGETMPRNRPGSLTAETCADIVGFLLQANGLPAGVAELPGDAEPLGRILMAGKDGD